MALIFVHGVYNRESPAYRAGIAVKRKFFDDRWSSMRIGGATLNPVTLPGDASFPYWGDLGAKFAWNMASLPRDRVETLGVESREDDLQMLAATIAEHYPHEAKGPEPLTAIANNHGLPAVAPLLTEAMIASAAPADQDAIGAIAATIAAYAEHHPWPDWLPDITTDSGLVSAFAYNTRNDDAQADETLGVAGAAATALQRAATAIGAVVGRVAGVVIDRSGNVITRKLLDLGRPSFNRMVGTFLGDVFTYLKTRADGEIPSRIGDAIAEVAREKGPLTVVAHSLGGIITYDVLTHFRKDIHVDLLVTVGSQVAHFEELKLCSTSDATLPGEGQPKLAKPANVTRWINVYDRADFLSYLCEPVFHDVQDLPHDAKTHAIKAHTAYFEDPGFYQGVRETVEGKP